MTGNMGLGRSKEVGAIWKGKKEPSTEGSPRQSKQVTGTLALGG
jgi:hypothetical protein